MDGEKETFERELDALKQEWNRIKERSTSNEDEEEKVRVKNEIKQLETDRRNVDNVRTALETEISEEEKRMDRARDLSQKQIQRKTELEYQMGVLVEKLDDDTFEQEKQRVQAEVERMEAESKSLYQSLEKKRETFGIVQQERNARSAEWQTLQAQADDLQQKVLLSEKENRQAEDDLKEILKQRHTLESDTKDIRASFKKITKTKKRLIMNAPAARSKKFRQGAPAFASAFAATRSYDPSLDHPHSQQAYQRSLSHVDDSDETLEQILASVDMNTLGESEDDLPPLSNYDRVLSGGGWPLFSKLPFSGLLDSHLLDSHLPVGSLSSSSSKPAVKFAEVDGGYRSTGYFFFQGPSAPPPLPRPPASTSSQQQLQQLQQQQQQQPSSFFTILSNPPRESSADSTAATAAYRPRQLPSASATPGQQQQQQQQSSSLFSMSPAKSLALDDRSK